MQRLSKQQVAASPTLPTVDPVELMMATVGIKAIISREVEPVTKAMLEQMHTLPERIYKDIHTMVNGGDIEYEPEPYNYRKSLQDLAQGWDIEQVQEMTDKFPPGFTKYGQALVIRSQEIIQVMLRDYPMTSYQTVAGSDSLAPSDTKMFRFVNVLTVIDHPECVPYYIHCGGLLQSQVKAMRAVYPTLSEFIDACLFDAITKAKANKKSFQLPFRVEYGVKAWWGRPPISDQSLAKAQMVAKASTSKKQIAEQNQAAPPPTRSDASNSPDTTELQKSGAGAG
jgi:hypothetical protein